MNRTQKNNNKFNSQHINALRYWVVEEERGIRRNSEGKNADTKTVDERIKELIQMMPPLTEELIVYRGQKGVSTIHPHRWFSTSDVRSKATDFVGEGCCLFKIYVQPGIRVLDVHSFLDKHYTKGIVSHEDEHEIIIESGGQFYTDPSKKQKGFKEGVKGELVGYYFPRDDSNLSNKNNTNRNNNKTRKNTKLNAKRILNRIPKNEYDLINGIEDVRTFLLKNESVNNSTLEEVFKTINKINK